LVIFFSSAKSVYFNQNFSALKLFLMLDHTKPYVEKMHYIDAELTGHVHINLTWNCRVCAGVDFSVCCARACQALPLWSELTNNTLRKQRWGTFLYPQIWMP